MINPRQCRAARAALGWSVRELGNKAGVSYNTVNRFEMGSDPRASTIDAIETAFIGAGVRFPDPTTVKLPEVA